MHTVLTCEVSTRAGGRQVLGAATGRAAEGSAGKTNQISQKVPKIYQNPSDISIPPDSPGDFLIAVLNLEDWYSLIKM